MNLSEKLPLNGTIIKVEDVREGDLIECYDNNSNHRVLRFRVKVKTTLRLHDGSNRSFSFSKGEEVGLIDRSVIKEPEGLGAIVRHEQMGLLVRNWNDDMKKWWWHDHQRFWDWDDISAGVTDVVQQGVSVKMIPGRRPMVPLVTEFP